MEEAFFIRMKNIENCYNITSLIRNSIEKEYIALVSSYDDHLIYVSIYEYQSKNTYFHTVVSDIQGFIDGIAKIFDSKIKAVILNVYGFSIEKFPNNIQFCKSLKAKFDAIKIPYFFISDYDFLTTKMLIAANISVDFGEFVLVLLIADKFVTMIELKYTKAGYEFVRQQTMDESDEELGEKILGTNELQKIVFCSDKPDKPLIRTLKNILKAESKKFVFVNDMRNDKYNGDGVIEEAKWIFDKKYIKFHVLPTIVRAYVIGYECGEEEVAIFMEKNIVALPYEKNVIASKSSFNHFIGYYDLENEKACRLETFTLGDDNYHEYEITLKVDVHNQPSYAVRGIKVQQIIDFPSLCKENMDNDNFEKFGRFPFIGFYGNHSFICIWDGTKEEYKFLDNWGGQWGKPMHIAFDKEKPYFGKAAEETFGKLGKFVVSDLFEVMIRTEEELQEYEHPSFTITKDDENPVLLEFDSTKKAASPAFLLAFLLKKHFKEIKKETGEKPNGLGFCILTDLCWEDIELAYNCLDDACNMLKFGNYTFFDWRFKV